MKKSMALVLALITLLVSFSLSASAEQTYTIVISAQVSATDFATRGTNHLAEIIEERSGGRIKVDLQYNGVLGSQGSEIDMFNNEICDMAVTSVTSNSDKLKELSYISLPLVPDAETSLEVLNTLQAEGYFDEMFAENDIRLAWWQTNESAYIFLKGKKVETLEDLQGLKIAYPGGPYTKLMLDKLGAVATGLNFSDFYMSLTTGVIDGVVLAPQAICTLGFLDAVDYLPLTVTSYGGCNSVFISQSFWDSLPADLQEVLEECFVECQQVYYDAALAYYEEDRQILTDAGIEIYEVDPAEVSRWEEAVAPCVDEWVAAMTKQGIPAQEIIDIARSVIDGK